MSTISKDQLQALRLAMNAALLKVASDHKLEFLRAGNCSFDPSGSFTFKVEGVVLGAPLKEQVRYDREHDLMELPPRGTQFDSRGRKFRIWGMNSTASKIICEAPNGQKYEFRTDALRALLAEQGGAKEGGR